VLQYGSELRSEGEEKMYAPLRSTSTYRVKGAIGNNNNNNNNKKL
jgi:hypothetical protein